MNWLAIVLFIGLALASPVDSNRMLVVSEDTSAPEYAATLSDLAAHGYDLDIRQVKDKDYELLRHGRRAYDHLLILPLKSSRSHGTRLSAATLLRFLEAGGNIAAVTSAESSVESVREFANELDIHISPKGYQLTDHFVGQGPAHASIALDRTCLDAPAPVVDGTESLIVESAGAAYLGNNPLVVPLAHAPSTAYVYNTKEEEGFAKTLWTSGSQAYVAAGFQSLANARFVWLGSAAIATDPANAQFASQALRWAFHDRAVVQVRFTRHGHPGQAEPTEPHGDRRLYKINDELEYAVALSEWTGDAWVPFSNSSAVQVEFTMLDPYYRITLEAVDSADDYTIYQTQFRVPDQHGVFTLRARLNEPGYSVVDDREIVVVRHTANDEWPRSWQITNSWVYLTSIGSVIASWLVFVLLYLYSS